MYYKTVDDNVTRKLLGAYNHSSAFPFISACVYKLPFGDYYKVVAYNDNKKGTGMKFIVAANEQLKPIKRLFKHIAI